MLQLRAQDPTRGVPFVPDPFSSVVPDAPFGAARPIKDNLYRLTLETVTDALSTLVYEKSFVYDDVGNRETQTTTGLGSGTINYTYDDRDRLLTENGTTYGYDDNGNLTSKSGESIYTWDFEDRLIRVDKDDGTVVEHVYDTDGVRVRTTTTPAGGSTTVANFLVDTSGMLSHVVAESDESGAFAAYYVRGDDLLSVIRPTEQRYYHADGLGSIRLLSDELGNITDSYVYTAFGEELSHVGPDVQLYQFAGEPFDPNVGFYYNRARWLDPLVGRFVGMDVFSGRTDDPMSLHRYLYASADPVNMVDPSGLFSLASVTATLGAISVLSVVGLVSLRPAVAFARQGVSGGQSNSVIQKAIGNVLTIFSTCNACTQFFVDQKRATDATLQLSGVLQRGPVANPLTIIEMSFVTKNPASIITFDNQGRPAIRRPVTATVNQFGSFFWPTNPQSGKTNPPVGDNPRHQAATPKARVLALLHEIGHMVFRPGGPTVIPDDNGNTNSGQSLANTKTIQNACRAQIAAVR